MPDQKVLVVDDDDEFLRSATEILTERGYEVVTANNPTQARKELEHGDADLAILDVRIGVDRKDITGLILARTLAPAMPKVVRRRGIEARWQRRRPHRGFSSG